MSRSLLNHARVFDGSGLHEGRAVLIEDGRVAAVSDANSNPKDCDQVWDLGNRLLAPGLIDIQVNGGGGVLFNDAPTVDTIRRIGRAHRPFGTTGFLPTLISDSRDKLRRALQAVRDARAEGVPGVLGIHVEGPFLNPEYRGIHDAGHIRALEEDDIRLLAEPGLGVIVLTVAPEIVGAKAIRRLADAGLIVSAGHSAASHQQVREALQAGLHGFTHLFNAMTPLGSREPGMVGAALEDRRSWVGIIADGHHVHPASLAVAVAAKPAGLCLLVTDAMATVGGEDRFEWNGETVSVVDGCCRLPNGRLAGSSLNMIAAVANAQDFARVDSLEALRMGSLYPARALGLDGELGRIEPGYRANFIELDEEMTVQRSWIDGAVQEHAGVGD